MTEALQIILKPETWVELLKDKQSLSQVTSGVLQGLIYAMVALAAGVFTILTFLREKERQNHTEFLRWLGELNSSYQGNETYNRVRVKLASDRSTVRRMICAELLSDGLIKRDVIPLEDQAYFERIGADLENEIDWEFLRQFTDYLYFFEQVLAFGQSLLECTSKTYAFNLVNHFGWFLRSLCMAWSRGKSEEVAAAASIFALYLATNRYARLTEVAVCFLRQHTHKSEPENSMEQIFQGTLETINQFRRMHPEDRMAPIIIGDILPRWQRLVGSIGVVCH